MRSQPWTDHRVAVERAAAGLPVLDTVLRTGDALYLPRGYLHSARALDTVSAHLTVGVHPITRYDIVEALVKSVTAEPELRASLPVGDNSADSDAFSDEVAETVTALVKRLESVDSAGVAAAVRAKAWAAARPAPLDPFGQAATVQTLSQQTVVRLRGHLRTVLSETDADRITLRLPDRTISLPSATRPAVERLMADAPVAVEALPGLEPEERLVLVRRLLREGVLVPSE